jgi:AraC-like DNA-binding protein
VVCGGLEHCEPDFRIDRSNFPFFSLEFVARGKGQLIMDEQAHALIAGTVFAYGPGVHHVISTDPENRLVKYFVDFMGTRALPMMREFALAPGAVVHVGSPTQVLAIFDDLITSGRENRRYQQQLCSILLKYLILKIADTVVTGDMTGTPAYATYHTCREYMAAHCTALQTLSQWADACHIDEAYLCRLFKRFGDLSPYQSLMRQKMRLAASRLQRPETLIKEIAFELGFSSAFHFSRAFKKAYGVSPDAFRHLRVPPA